MHKLVPSNIIAAHFQEIGWRENAHHIVIYLTDAGFHMGSDGIVSYP